MVIKKGDINVHVIEVQKALGLEVDGDFGSDTKRAVIKFQKENGLVADGIVGKKTLSVMGILDRHIFDIRTYSVAELLDRVSEMEGFVKIPSGYWIIGIRNQEDHPDRYDDIIYLMYNKTLIKRTTGTTNPGLKVLRGGFKSYNKNGAAIVKSDKFYPNLWKFGKHKGYMEALVQKAIVTVFRDKDCDYLAEEQGKEYKGFYGINFHTATKNYLSNLIKTIIGGWSSGCIVCNNTKDYRLIIAKIKKQNLPVSFCLLKEF
jgi:hypothetical protein